MTSTSDPAFAATEPVEKVRALFETLNQRNPDALWEFWADDIVNYWPHRTYRGRAEVRGYFEEVFAAVPDYQVHVEKIAGHEDTVFVQWRLTGTATGRPWRGIECNGARLDLHGVDCFTVRNGKVVENTIVFDQLDIARQIGLLPSEGSFIDRMGLKLFNVTTRLKKRLHGQ